jgi:hypothetical protein
LACRKLSCKGFKMWDWIFIPCTLCFNRGNDQTSNRIHLILEIEYANSLQYELTFARRDACEMAHRSAKETLSVQAITLDSLLVYIFCIMF